MEDILQEWQVEKGIIMPIITASYIPLTLQDQLQYVGCGTIQNPLAIYWQEILLA